jgi:hypothetical protein
MMSPNPPVVVNPEVLVLVLLVVVIRLETLVNSEPNELSTLLVVKEVLETQGNVAVRGSWLAATEVKFAV